VYWAFLGGSKIAHSDSWPDDAWLTAYFTYRVMFFLDGHVPEVREERSGNFWFTRAGREAHVVADRPRDTGVDQAAGGEVPPRRSEQSLAEWRGRSHCQIAFESGYRQRRRSTHQVLQSFVDGLTDSADATDPRNVCTHAGGALDLSCFAYLALRYGRGRKP
jgi:hypothetical protein